MSNTNKTAQRQKAQLIKDFIELEPVGQATLFASIMSMGEAEHSRPAEARQWWLLVAILSPDVAQRFGSHISKTGL